MEIDWQKRQELLSGLADIVGTPYAEREHQFTQMFYPVPEHAKIFDPDIVLIVGGHGTGKSTWFKAVVEQNLMPQIARWIPSSRLSLSGTEKISWLAGYPLGTAFADPIHLSRFVNSWADEKEALYAVSDVWFAYLVRVLKDTLKPFLSSDHYPLFAPKGHDIDAIYQAFRHSRMSFIGAMDELERALQDTDRWVFMNYDALETIAGIDWAATNLLIRGLLTLWATYARRWNRIRAKIFLRADLFRGIRVSVADFTKLASYRLELTWSPRSLYAMLAKRLLNASDALREYTLATRGLQVEHDETLGLIPIFENWEASRPLIERLAGPYMGANIKKGRTFTWILDHLADGKGIVTPRAIVDLVRQSACEELEFSRAKGEHLLHPTSIRRALDRVSEEYMKTLQDRELPWLRGVSERIQGAMVPIGRDEAEKMLAINWEHWEAESDIRPPVDTPHELVDVLIELGVFRQRLDGRIDVPDLFLAGLGLKRKGGVRRR